MTDPRDCGAVLKEVADVIDSRRGADPKSSYVASLFKKAPDGMLKKIGEEACETVIIYECADLWFHTMVMLSYYGLRPEDVTAELARREGLSGLAEKASRPKD